MNHKRKRHVEINKLLSQQRHIYKKMNHLIFRKKPIGETGTVRIGFKLLQCHMRFASIKASLYALISSPIPKYQNGGIIDRGFAMVGETGKELIIAPNGKVHVSCSTSCHNTGDIKCSGNFNIGRVPFFLESHNPDKSNLINSLINKSK